MRRLAIIIVAILVVAELGARTLETRIPGPLTWESQFTQTKASQIADTGQVDVVFLGSSVVNAGIDPDVVDSASTKVGVGYNAALPAYGPSIWHQWYEDVAGPSLCPRLLVIGMDIRQFNDNKPGREGQLAAYEDSYGRRVWVGENLNIFERGQHILEDASALFRIRRRLREPDKLVAWVTGWGDVGDWRILPITPRGRYTNFDDNVYTSDEQRITDLKQGAFRDFAIGGAETDAVGEIISYAQAHGTTVVLVEMPAMTDRLALALPDGFRDLGDFADTIQSLGQRYDVPVLTFTEFDNQTDLFADEYHLNGLGHEVFSRDLAGALGRVPLAAGNTCESDRT